MRATLRSNRPALLTCAIALALATGACERPRVAPSTHADSTASLTAEMGQAFRRVDAVDSVFADTLLTALSHLLYQGWKGDTASRPPYCGDEEADGYAVQAAWGVARLRLLSFDELDGKEIAAGADTAQREASALVEAVRVFSVESKALDDEEKDHDESSTLTLGIVTDTARIDWERRNGRWSRCGAEWIGDGRLFPVSFVGPDTTWFAPAEKLRRVPSTASWARARALADSVGRAEPAVVDARRP